MALILLDFIKLNYFINFIIMNIKNTPEYEKNLMRIKDIVRKSNGDSKKMVNLAKQQTSRITNEIKALYRGKVAEDENQHEIAEIFYRRAHELGSMSTAEFAKYKLNHVLNFLEKEENEQ